MISIEFLLISLSTGKNAYHILRSLLTLTIFSILQVLQVVYVHVIFTLVHCVGTLDTTTFNNI